uniref:Uncharacterized protein n=1 Tax=Alexandrium andersonii TaxID=327968 RepID=A0A7S2NLP0_9DINO
MLTALPVFGVRWLFFGMLLLMLAYPGPADEYQLVQFILHFKGTQFFTAGVIMAFTGSMEMLVCVLSYKDDLRHCVDRSGPGAKHLLVGMAVEYIGSVALVWIAFTMLPRSRKHPRLATLQHMSAMQIRGRYCCCLEGVLSQGGRLWRLLSYDIVCFGVSASAFTLEYAVYAASQGLGDSLHPNLSCAKALMYWANCLYALLSLPFAFFLIPGLTRLLTHSVITGYNSHGELVEFAFPQLNGCKGV